MRPTSLWGTRGEPAAADDTGLSRRRAWSAEQRLEIVLQSFRGTEPNTEICRRNHISEPTLYKWRQLFLNGGKSFLADTGAGVRALVEENQQLKEMLVDLSSAYRRLAPPRRTLLPRP